MSQHSLLHPKEHMILSLSNKQKQRCPILSERMVDLIVFAIERSENEIDSTEANDHGYSPILFLWQHLSFNLFCTLSSRVIPSHASESSGKTRE